MNLIIAIFFLLVQQKLIKTLLFIHNFIFLYEEQNIENLKKENLELQSISNKSDISSNCNDKRFNTSHNIDITAALGPGIYAIINEKSGQIYFGESDLICARLGRHKKSLDTNVHENLRLQEAWSKDSAYFKFVILEYGLDWKDSNTRRIKEKELILANIDNCFNQIPGTPT